jgi:hypothetical protein
MGVRHSCLILWLIISAIGLFDIGFYHVRRHRVHQTDPREHRLHTWLVFQHLFQTWVLFVFPLRSHTFYLAALSFAGYGALHAWDSVVEMRGRKRRGALSVGEQALHATVLFLQTGLGAVFFRSFPQDWAALEIWGRLLASSIALVSGAMLAWHCAASLRYKTPK